MDGASFPNNPNGDAASVHEQTMYAAWARTTNMEKYCLQ